MPRKHLIPPGWGGWPLWSTETPLHVSLTTVTTMSHCVHAVQGSNRQVASGCGDKNDLTLSQCFTGAGCTGHSGMGCTLWVSGVFYSTSVCATGIGVILTKFRKLLQFKQLIQLNWVELRQSQPCCIYRMEMEILIFGWGTLD